MQNTETVMLTYPLLIYSKDSHTGSVVAIATPYP